MNVRFAAALGRRMLRGRDGTARYLRGAVLGIAVSLVPLVVVMEVSTGMIQGITARLLEIGTYHLQIPLPPATSIARLTELSAAVADVAGVIAAVPERQGTGMIVSSTGAVGVSIRCVPADVFSRDAGFASYLSIRSGAPDLSEKDSVLLSSALAASLNVHAGESVNVLTTWDEAMAGPPRLTPVRVVGIYETGYQELDATLAYGSLSLADRIFSVRSSRTIIGVKVKDPFGNLAAIERGVYAAAGGDVNVSTWREIEFSRLASFRTTKALLLFIMALIVAVAAVNVSSAVLMILFERRHELGILKSIGADPASLAASYLLTGLVTGAAGTAIGLGFGLLVAVNINQVMAGITGAVNAVLALVSLAQSAFVPGAKPLGSFTLFNSAYYLSSIPIKIDVAEIVVAAASTILLSALAAYFPAARTARIRPMEILKKV